MKKTNGVMMQYFEWYLPENCKLWKQLSKNAAELNKKGFTALWLPPAYKGQAGKSDVGYGVYDLYDLGEFDQKGSVETKYGSRDEYLKAIDDLHANGLQVYADIVLDHKIGADEQEIVEAVQDAEDDRNREVSDTRSKPGRNSLSRAATANIPISYGIIPVSAVSILTPGQRKRASITSRMPTGARIPIRKTATQTI